MIPAHLVPNFDSREDREVFIIEATLKLAACIAEYEDDTFGKRKHFSDATYQDGCPGPLCSAAHRIYARGRTGAQPSAYWATYEPILEWFNGLMQQRVAAHEALIAADWQRMLWKEREWIDEAHQTMALSPAE